MAGVLSIGPRVWGMKRDNEGHRTYNVTHQVRTTLTTDGPAVVMDTPGLPLVGSQWNFGAGEFDLWATCYPEMDVQPRYDNEKCRYYDVTQKFGTRPIKKCQDASVDDPLMEPQKVSGTFVSSKVAATTDRNGDPIVDRAWDMLTGPITEFDEGFPTVHIEQNVATLGLSTLAQYHNKVNSVVMWGLAVRCVKLSNIAWRRNVYGLCNFYYTRVFDFEVNYNTFDRSTPSYGNKALNGRWATEPEIALDIKGWQLIDIDNEAPDKTIATHYSQYKDQNLEPAKCFLDANGIPSTAANALEIDIEYYDEANLFFLGVPATF